ncbi:MAG TPA: hypothetical protein VEC57_11130 [Candidatus Limnocylindrales bacterium]|nr:hypothetical protein [Candidatus Limnocylindrales bacterium]
MSRKLSALIVTGCMVAVLSPAAARAQAKTYFRTDTPEFQESMKAGYQMFKAFQCAKCHATREGQELNKDIIAPNLILAKKRLRPEWILAWMIDPQKLQPGTKMPNFFTFNENPDGSLNLADAEAHNNYKTIVALRDYLMVLGTEADPGLNDPLPVPTNEQAAPANAPAADEQYLGY